MCAGVSEQSSDHLVLDFEKQIKDLSYHKKEPKKYIKRRITNYTLGVVLN